MFAAYILQNGWTDLSNELFYSLRLGHGMVLGRKKISQIGPPVLEKYLILPFRKIFFSKREDKILFQNGWTDLAIFFWA